MKHDIIHQIVISQRISITIEQCQSGQKCGRIPADKSGSGKHSPKSDEERETKRI
jgi:hypothetical protein